jgi:hypothetical protein
MNHTEAVELWAAERYLLDELAPEVSDAFEQHFFDCPECAIDLRACSLLIDETKAELLNLPKQQLAQKQPAKSKSSFWLAWLQPAFAMPAFAALLAIVVFQNTVTLPTLREASTQPRLLPLNHLRPATRGADHFTVAADRIHGAALQVEFAPSTEAPAQSYSFELLDAQGKLLWSTTAPASGRASDQDQQFSLYLPGAKLRNGTYSLQIAGLDAQDHRTPIEDYMFDIVINGQ